MDQDKEFLDLKAQVVAQAAEIARLKTRLDGERQANGERDNSEAGGPTSRRQLFKLAGAVAVGAAGASLLSAAPAGATTGTMMFGAVNDAGSDLTQLISTNSTQTLVVSNAAAVAGSVALFGSSTGLSPSAGVLGEGSGYGVAAAGGLAQLLLFPAGAPGPPTTNFHQPGEVFVDSNGALFQCVAAGTPGTWVRVGFNPLTPVRILDTRNATGGITGPLTAGQSVSLTVGGNNGVPAQASAVVMNATVTETSTASFLTIWPEGVTRPLASNLNWAADQTVPNQVTVKLGTGGGISIFNDLGTVQVILDLAGFYS